MESAKAFKFNWVEYSVVFFMVFLSTLIGVYYTFFNKQKTFQDYMLGGKTMGVFPVSMSLIASFISGITLLGLPTEIYVYGSQYMICNVAHVIIMTLTGVFYLPVYYNLQLTSIFEYLELRFDKNVRLLGNFMYSLTMILFLPTVLYVPAIAFNEVTGVSIHVITIIITTCCIFYTAFGGLKAVLWTDALQALFMYLAVVFVCVLGCVRLGGLREVWRINQEGHRLELFNLDPSPFVRNTFWSVSIGCVFMHLTNIAANPGSVQRFLAVPSLRHARWVLFYSTIGFYVIINMSYFLGFILYARYHSCDPVATGIIKKPSQLVPLYLMEIGQDYPGLAGLFMAGVLSAALSTVSSWLNTMGGTIYKDVMEVYYPNVHHSDAKQSTIIKAIVITLGIVSVIMVAVVERLGTILQVAVSLQGTAYGSILALYSLGLFFPRVNTKGAVVGTLTSLLVTGWIICHAQLYILTGKIKFPGKITSVDQCPRNTTHQISYDSSLLSTFTGRGTPVVADASVPLVYQVSYNYYVVIGTVVGVVVGLAVSLVTKPPDYFTMNPAVFSPCVHRFLPKRLQAQIYPDRSGDRDIYKELKVINTG